MHIALFVPFLFRYSRGIERSASQLANALCHLGYTVTMMTWRERHPKADFHLDPAISVCAVPYMRYFRSQWAVPFYTYWLLSKHIDTVIVYFAGYGEAQAIYSAARFRNIQINFIVGYPYELVPHRFREFQQLGLEQYLDHIIVKSPSMGPAIERVFNRNDIVCIPNGVDIDHWQARDYDTEGLRDQFGIPANSAVLTTVAALEERKGIHRVIGVLPQLRESGMPVHYVVVGEGPYRTQLESMASEMQVADQVHFVGRVHDVRPLYALADVFLLLSYGEGFPNVLLEAWAMQLPVVVSHHDPYPSIVTSKTAVMVNEEDREAVAETISRLVQSPATRRQMGQSARQHVEEGYTWEAIAKQYAALFRRASLQFHSVQERRSP